MNTTGRPDALGAAKCEVLRTCGTLNPRPERVSAPLFREDGFFDPRDLVQVKYEMLRQASREGVPVQTAAQTHGFSRMAWYQIRSRYDAHGLLGLLPRPRGPRRPPPKTALVIAPCHAAELCEHYERLRRQALTSAPPDGGWGLLVFLRQGMAAWMQAWAAQTAPAPILSPATPENPAGYDQDWVLALAALVLGQPNAKEVPHG